MTEFDPATISWVERVKAAGGEVSEGMAIYVHSVIKELKTNGGFEAADAYFIGGRAENGIQERMNVIGSKHPVTKHRVN